MSLNEFLVWLTAGGSIIAVSFFAERWTKFQELSSEAKLWFMFASCTFVSLCAFAILQFVPIDMLNRFAPWFAVISANFYALFISKAFHLVDKN